jgi:hypothetical protein
MRLNLIVMYPTTKDDGMPYTTPTASIVVVTVPVLFNTSSIDEIVLLQLVLYIPIVGITEGLRLATIILHQ